MSNSFFKTTVHDIKVGDQLYWVHRHFKSDQRNKEVVKIGRKYIYFSDQSKIDKSYSCNRSFPLEDDCDWLIYPSLDEYNKYRAYLSVSMLLINDIKYLLSEDIPIKTLEQILKLLKENVN